MDLNIILWLGGMLFSLSIFAMKVGFGFSFGGLKWKGILAVLAFYFLLFVLIALFSGFLKDLLKPFLSKGFYLHALMAAGMIIWGIYLVRQLDSSTVRQIKAQQSYNPIENAEKTIALSHYRSAALLLIPCPVCLSAMAFSSWAALGIIELPAVLVGVGLGVVFIVLSLAFYFSIRHFARNSIIASKIGLGLSMIAIGFYFIASLFIPAKIEEAKLAYKAFAENQVAIDMPQAIGLLLLFLAVFAAGFILNINKEDIHEHNSRT